MHCTALRHTAPHHMTLQNTSTALHCTASMPDSPIHHRSDAALHRNRMFRVARLGLGLAVGCSAGYAVQQQWVFGKEGAEGAFNPKEFRKFKLLESQTISHDTRLFRFALPADTPEMGLPTASCIVTRYATGNEGEYVIRPYTPTTLNDTKGHFDLVIKKYPDAKMAGHIFSLKPGDELEVKGPIIKQRYVPNKYKHIGMIAGGTGITPMYQVAQEVLKNPDDKTEIDLIYGNKTEDDILLRKELDALAKKHPNFRVHYTLDSPGGMWRGDKGFVTPAMVSSHFPGAKSNSYVYVCGPMPMMKAVSGGKAKDYSQGEVDGVLKELGYTKDMVFKF